MRFSEKMYSECFPVEKPKATIESAVETFKPTQDVIDQEGNEGNEPSGEEDTDLVDGEDGETEE